MDAEHPRDVDPSITGQPHQVTDKVSDLMGNISRTLGNWADMPAAVPIPVPPQPFVRPVQTTRPVRTAPGRDHLRALP